MMTDTSYLASTGYPVGLYERLVWCCDAEFAYAFTREVIRWACHRVERVPGAEVPDERVGLGSVRVLDADES